jgi:hypothetical protein
MPKKMSIIFLCIIALGFISIPIDLQAGDTTQKITGKIKDVDLEEKSVVVGTPDGDMVFYIETGSQIKKGTETITIKDLKIGIVIEMTFKTSGDDHIAELIVVVS